jgi:hypothetical protein
MPEILIPDQLTHDCDNCQGLCCVANLHKIEDGFPIDEDKTIGIPCEHLELDPTTLTGIHKCKIHHQLGKLGWNICKNFTCNGAGQAVTDFFKEMGVVWSHEKPENLDDEKWYNQLENFYLGYIVLQNVFNFLAHIRKHKGETIFLKVKTAIKELMPEFSMELTRIDGCIDHFEWIMNRFDPVIRKILDESNTSIRTRANPRTSPSVVPASRLSDRSKS